MSHRIKSVQGIARKKRKDEEERVLKELAILNKQTPVEKDEVGYTVEDAVSVGRTGSLPTKKPKTDYDTYMAQATDIYNKSVAEADKMAQSQSAMAGAQYREVQRNLNELNKASGKANTGYAEDTSINAYNSYRNAVNESYANADKTKNELYSYYINEMRNLQAEKVAQENNEENLDITNIETYYYNNAEKYADESLTPDGAKDVYDYTVNMYGGEENIPQRVWQSLLTMKGFNTWYTSYKSGEETPTNNGGYDTIIKTSDNKSIAVLDIGLHANSSQIRDKVGQNNFRVSIDGKTYQLETATVGEQLGGRTADEIKNQIQKVKGREAQEGDFVYYNGYVYVIGKNGRVCKVQSRSLYEPGKGYNEFMMVVKEKLGIK